MGPLDYVIIGVIILIVGAAVAYIIKAKRSGQKCIGCPDSKTCGGACHSCSCNCGDKKDDK